MSISLGTYTESFSVSSTDTDAAYECRPSALFVFLQKAITAHSRMAGTSRDDVLAKYNCYWMILRTWVRLNRPIIWGNPAGGRSYPAPPGQAALPGL